MRLEIINGKLDLPPEKLARLNNFTDMVFWTAYNELPKPYSSKVIISIRRYKEYLKIPNDTKAEERFINGLTSLMDLKADIFNGKERFNRVGQCNVLQHWFWTSPLYNEVEVCFTDRIYEALWEWGQMKANAHF